MTDDPQQIQRFVITQRLGAGGMGTVYRARDPQLDRDVAIKVLRACEKPAELLAQRTIDLRARSTASSEDLISEARIMARLSHPNVVPIYEIGLDGDAVFLVMEHIVGCDFRTWVAKPRRREAVLELLVQAGMGLAAAHAEGIIHRDFKPDNILVGDDGRARVADFGLSRFNGPTASLIRSAEERGTPAYMAPELWRGEPATIASDLYAFCVTASEALVGECTDPARRLEALRAAGLSTTVVRAMVAGLADDPRARPELTAILAALQPRRSHRVPIALAAVVGTLVVGGIVLMTSDEDATAAACATEPALPAGTWDGARRAKLVAVLGERYAAVDRSIAPTLATAIDDYVRELAELRRTTCEARQRGQLAPAEAEIRSSCLDRRAFELAAITRRLIDDGKLAIAGVKEQAINFQTAASCIDITTAALPDPARASELYGRYIQTQRLDVGKRIEALEALEVDARALGDLELEARIPISIATLLRATGRLAESDAKLETAYRRTTAIHADVPMTVALIERSATAEAAGNRNGAHDLAKLALASSSRPGIPPRIRARAYLMFGRALFAQGDDVRAVANGREALAMIAENRAKVPPTTELELRQDLAMALARINGRTAEAVALARETVEVARRLVGEHDLRYAATLDGLANAIRGNNDTDEALALRRRALAVFTTTAPQDPRGAELQTHIAHDLNQLGRFAEAHQEATEALARASTSQPLLAKRPEMLLQVGVATIGLAKFDEGMAILEEAGEAVTSMKGTEHPRTAAVRTTLTEIALALDRLPDAERNYAAARRAYGHPTSKIDLPYFEGTVGARLARARGNPRDAERRARSALHELAEVTRDERYRGPVLLELGASLNARRDHAGAYPVLVEALAIAERSKFRADELAEVQIELARAELGLGKIADARVRITPLREVAERFPGKPRLAKQVAELASRAR